MKIFLAGTQLTDWADFPAQGVLVNGQCVTEDVAFVRAVQQRSFPRGNSSITLQFNVSKVFGSLRDAQSYLLTIFSNLPKSGQCQVICGVPGESPYATVTFASAVLSAMPQGNFNGLEVNTQFTINTGAAEVVVNDPSSIAGLALWLKADSLGLADGAAVAAWPDSSGTGNDATQATGALQPILKRGIINGRSVVRFDGANDYMSFPNDPGANTSVFVVAAVNVAAGALPAYASFIISGSGLFGFNICARLATTNWGTYCGADESAGEVLGIGVFNILGLDTGGALTYVYRNGVQKNSLAVHSNGNSGGGNLIGLYAPASGRYLNGDIAEIVAYNSVLAAADRQFVEDYFGFRYNIAVTH